MKMKVVAIVLGLLVATMVAGMPAAAQAPSPKPAPKQAPTTAPTNATTSATATFSDATPADAATAKPSVANPSIPKPSTAKPSSTKPPTGKLAAKTKDDPDAAVEAIGRPSATQLAAMGWRIIDDPATGAQVGLPSALVPKTAPARMGSRWTSGLGQIDVETFRLHEAALAALFDDEKKIRHRAVEHSALKPDSFVISGMQGLKRFVERVEASGSELRGITILFDQATEGTMAPVAAAMADTFVGFPDPNAGPPPGLRRSVEYGTAIVASDRGYLLAAAPVVDQCQSITIAGLGHAERIAVDSNNDLALLRLYGAQNLTPAGLGGDAASADNLTLTGIADPLAQAGDATVTAVPAHSTVQGLDPMPKLGFSGAAATDPQGRFVGMVDLKWPQVASAVTTAAGVTGQAALIAADTVHRFLIAQGITPSTGRTPIDQSVLRVICVRK
jgi:S1-C subfamily serine protease